MSGSQSAISVQSATTYFDKSKQYGKLAATIMTVLGGAFIFVFSVFQSIAATAARQVNRLLRAFGLGGQEWILAFTRDPANFIGQSFQAAAASFSNSAWAQLGPFLPWLATASGLGVVALVTWYLDRRDSDVPGLGANIPVIGNAEDGDPSDEDAQ